MNERNFSQIKGSKRGLRVLVLLKKYFSMNHPSRVNHRFSSIFSVSNRLYRFLYITVLWMTRTG